MEVSLGNISEICIAIEIAILGISYPIFIDKVSNIGQKYSSQYLQIVFEELFPQKSIRLKFRKHKLEIPIIKLSLILGLIIMLFQVIRIKPIISSNNYFINNSADILLLLSCILLTTLFLIWINLIILFNSSAIKLLPFLINRHNKTKLITNNNTKAIAEMTIYAIETQDEHIQMELVNFYVDYVSRIRNEYNKNMSDSELVYPEDFYFFIYKVIRTFNNTNNTKLSSIENLFVNGSLIVANNYDNTKIGKKSYNWLWNNLILIHQNRKHFKSFWANSHNYISYPLKSIYPKYTDYPNLENEKEYKNRIEERNKFKEFHIAIGGLMLYRKEYENLKHMLSYTQSLPPSYDLLPSNIDEIFYFVSLFSHDIFYGNKIIDLTYNFPELDNLSNRRQVKTWINKYLGILLIRQWSLPNLYMNQTNTNFPNLPSKIVELHVLNNDIDSFKRIIEELIEEELILNSLNLNENKTDEIKEYFRQLKENIENKIEVIKVSSKLDEIKINKFKSNAGNIIYKTLESYSKIFFEGIPDETLLSDNYFQIIGGYQITSKLQYTSEEDLVLSTENSLANSICDFIIKREIPKSFTIAKTQNYLIERDNLLLALNIITKNINEFVIITINEWFQTTEYLEKYKINRLKISSTIPGQNDTLYICPKEDLPFLVINDLEEEDPIKSNRNIINEKYKVYGDIIEFTDKGNRFKDYWPQNESNQNNQTNVLALIAMNLNWKFKKKRNIIELNIFNIYHERGFVNELSDLKPI